MSEATVLPAEQSFVAVKLESAKNFIKKHRVAIAVATTTSVFVALNLRNSSILDQFLADHNLTDEYYAEETPAETAALTS